MTRLALAVATVAALAAPGAVAKTTVGMPPSHPTVRVGGFHGAARPYMLPTTVLPYLIATVPSVFDGDLSAQLAILALERVDIGNVFQSKTG